MQDNTFKSYPVLDGGNIITNKITWLGDVREVKITKGKKDDPTTSSVWNFRLKVGYDAYQSFDYVSQEAAQVDYNNLLQEVLRS